MQIKIYSAPCEHLDERGEVDTAWTMRSYWPINPANIVWPTGRITICAGDLAGVEIEIDWIGLSPVTEGFSPAQLLQLVENRVPGFRVALPSEVQ